VIVRILGVGQFALDDADIAVVEKADDAVEAAIAARDGDAFTAALNGLVDTIQRTGKPVTDDQFVPSDVIVPDRDTTLEDAAAYHDDDGEGLIPG
jgi:PspAA-like protein